MQRLPVHGFVLAGGQGRRMGRDKAMLELGGQALIGWAVARLRLVCSPVSICGNRPDLARYADVVADAGELPGPAAGIVAGLVASQAEWAMFTPVDVPLVPTTLLRRWGETVTGDRARGSILRLGGREHPVFCCLHREMADRYRAAARASGGRLTAAWRELERAQPGDVQVHDAESLVDAAELPELARWFTNLNTADELSLVRGSFDAG